jgi:uncharacterized protein (TIGR03084 family)
MLVDVSERPDVIDDLEAEYARLDGILSALDEAAWRAPSAAEGWTVADVVLHLAQSEELAVAAVADAGVERSMATEARGVDDLAADRVVAERAAPSAVFERWRRSSGAAIAALRQSDPDRLVPWVGGSMKPATLATTRLAEHWAHGLDITTPLGIDFPDTDRLRHIAWLGHRTLPYAFQLAGEAPQPVLAELTAPGGGEVWRFGPPDAPSSIRGDAGAFCRVGAQRLRPDDSGLVCEGPHGRAALGVLRNYAA